jgi:predicted outer membrane repeat protein
MRRRLFILVLLLAGIAAAGSVPTALGAAFTANSPADEPDSKPGDGLCLTAAGDCTLRAAVQETNALGGGPHTIALLAGAVYTLTRGGAGEDAAATGDLDVASNVAISVPGGRAVVEGVVIGWDDRIFQVLRGSNAELEAIEIRRGRVDRGEGGGISNDGTLTLTNITVTRNHSDHDSGGGIYNGGTLTLTDSTVGSSLVSQGNFAGGRGGGIINLGTLTLTNSTVSGNTSLNGQGGGIYNVGTLTLTNSTVSSNRANFGSGGGIRNSAGTATLIGSTVSSNGAEVHGGGISNVSGTLTLTSSTVSSNGSSGSDGLGSGGGIDNFDGNVKLSGSTLNGNRAGFGGAISTEGGTLTVTNSTASDNIARHDGGAIFNGGTLTLTNSTVSGNSTGTDGGGIYLTQSSSLSVTNATISTNSAARNGGGIWNLGTVTANNVTIANNVADSNGDGAGDGGGIYSVSGGTVTVANTILGDNVDASAKFPDCLGSLTSAGYNVVENATGCTIGGATSSNITGRDPLLGPLQDNGGPTLTHALEVRTVNIFGTTGQVPSPAIDAGSPGGTAACANRDQRGTSRRDGNADGVVRCDIGAYEYVPPVFKLGTLALTPAEATVRPGERITYSLTWTVPSPRGWRSLRTLELAFLDDEGTALWVRFEEVAGAPGLFRIVNPKNGNGGPAFAPGSPNRLESESATVYLAETAVDGPPGQRVTLTLTLSFKPHAAGHSYDVLVAATDDTGEVQGFHRAGGLAVSG